MIAALLTILGVVLAAFVSALASVTVTKITAKSTRVAAEAEVQKAINDGFQKLTEGLRGQLKDTQGDLAGARRELKEGRAEMADLRGWVRELLQHIESLEIILRAHGVDIPKRQSVYPHALAIIEGGYKAPRG